MRRSRSGPKVLEDGEGASEGIHAFNRASFGTPQSLGCVELPPAAATNVWPYTPIGTLVMVEK